jgi:hypothetical protein
MVSKGNHPQMALIQVSEILSFAQIDVENQWFPLGKVIYKSWWGFQIELFMGDIFRG